MTKEEKEEKLKALQAAMQKIEKDFGKGAIMKLGEDKVENVDVIPTGSLGLDMALGVGGYPRGPGSRRRQSVHLAARQWRAGLVNS